MTLKILVCDDDPAFVDKMTGLLYEQARCQGKEILVTGCWEPGQLDNKTLTQFNIIFLDIDMGEYNGILLARRIRSLGLNTILIFVTQYVEFSIDGYEVRAFRYLLKEDLASKLPVYFKEAVAQLEKEKRALRFSVGGEDYIVKYENILYLESQLRKICLHTVQPERINEYFYATMDEMEKELFPAGFLRVQKSYLVNMQHIQKLKYDKVLLTDGTVLPVSQKKFSEIKLQYMNWKSRQ